LATPIGPEGGWPPLIFIFIFLKTWDDGIWEKKKIKMVELQ
jgi:hypothetical protein